MYLRKMSNFKTNLIGSKVTERLTSKVIFSKNEYFSKSKDYSNNEHTKNCNNNGRVSLCLEKFERSGNMDGSSFSNPN